MVGENMLLLVYEVTLGSTGLTYNYLARNEGTEPVSFNWKDVKGRLVLEGQLSPGMEINSVAILPERPEWSDSVTAVTAGAHTQSSRMVILRPSSQHDAIQ